MTENMSIFFSDFAEDVTIDGESVKALRETYFDDRDIERESLIVASESIQSTTESSTVVIGTKTYRITKLHVSSDDPAITTIILGASS
jgi:hypothetical protein